jgi:hypothetical protein
MGGMSRTSLVSLVTAPLLGALAAATLSACGTADPEIPQGSSSTATKKASFPLTVNRVGGIAGFSDSLSIQEDGEVLAKTRQGQVTCSLDDASLAVLNEAALQLHDTDQPTGSPTTISDQLDVLFGAGTGMVRIDDARVARSEPVVTQLLADVTGPEASRKICT